MNPPFHHPSLHVSNTLALNIRPVFLAYFGETKTRQTNYSPQCPECVDMVVHLYEVDISLSINLG